MRQVILDTETTGFETREGHRLIELGCLEMQNRRLTGKHLHFYFQPDREIDAGALAVHGITSAFLEDKPRFADHAKEIMAFLVGAELIIHNAAFDIGFLEYELSLLPHNPWGKVAAHCKVLDSLKLAREMHPGQRNSLDALCKRYDVDHQHREFHGALLDAELLAHVYLAMTSGQESLFDSLFFETPPRPAQNALHSTSGADPLSHAHTQPPVIPADPHALMQHEAYLALLSKQAKRDVHW